MFGPWSSNAAMMLSRCMMRRLSTELIQFLAGLVAPQQHMDVASNLSYLRIHVGNPKPVFGSVRLNCRYNVLIHSHRYRFMHSGWQNCSIYALVALHVCYTRSQLSKQIDTKIFAHSISIHSGFLPHPPHPLPRGCNKHSNGKRL